MRFSYLTDVPDAPEKPWFETQYAALRRKIDGTPDEAPPERWLELVHHWNEIKAVLEGEYSRRSWAEARDARDAQAEAAAKRHRGETNPVAAKEDASLRK